MEDLLRYLSVCSGIEAASVAWHPLGWHAVAFAEIEKFPCAVLAHHYPHVPNYGDMTRFKDWPDATFDLLVGGTPCQSFSVAGLRQGLRDPRGNLVLTYLAIADRYRPRWVVWENVPGALSATSHAAPDPCPPPPPVDMGCDGAEMETEDEYDAIEDHAFACLVAGFSELGYGLAYRSPDAQYFGLAQRRQRVFAIFHLGDWRRAAAVLFERESLSGHPAPRREAGQRATGTLSSRASAGGGLGTDFDVDGGLVPSTGDISHCLNAGGMGRIDYETETLISHFQDSEYGCQQYDTAAIRAGRIPEHSMVLAHSLRADGFDASEDGTGRGTPIVPTIAPCLTQNYGKQPDNSDTGAGPMLVAFSAKDSGADAGELSPTLRAGGHDKSHANAGCMPAVAFNRDARPDELNGGDLSTLTCSQAAAAVGMTVRRLTPRECERLQGFPDDTQSITIRVCRTEDERRALALSAANHLVVPSPEANRPVAVDALIDLERQHLQLRSLGKSSWSASIADAGNSSRLSIPLADFVRLVAATTSTLARETQIGAAASPLIINRSSAPWAGNVFVHLCGREIEELASDAGRFTTVLSHSMKFITSEAGQSSPSSEQTWRTLCSCVAVAIASCIPDAIRAGSSYDLKLTTISGYTLIPYRGKLAADGPRYKALGNSMAVPVMRWIGRRIQMVEAIR